MDYAVLLHFDSRTEERLQTAMGQLVEAGLNPTYRDLQMRPHLKCPSLPVARSMASRRFR